MKYQSNQTIKRGRSKLKLFTRKHLYALRRQHQDEALARKDRRAEETDPWS